MKTSKFSIVATMAVLYAGTAMAGFTAGPFSGNSTASAGNVGNTVNNYNHGGPDFVPGTFRIEGDLTRVVAGDYISENRIRIRNPQNQICDAQLSNVSNYAGTVHVGPTTITNCAFTGTSVGNWSFEMFNSADDGVGPDATWANLTVQANDFIPPPPPANFVDLGTYDGTYVEQMGHLGAGAINWYKINFANAYAAMQFSTHGTLFIPGAHPDTEIGLYNSLGQLIANNDDINYPADPYSFVNPNVAAGDYYIAVGGYDAVFSGAFAVSSNSTATGDYKLSIVPEPGTTALLALGGLFAARRRKA